MFIYNNMYNKHKEVAYMKKTNDNDIEKVVGGKSETQDIGGFCYKKTVCDDCGKILDEEVFDKDNILYNSAFKFHESDYGLLGEEDGKDINICRSCLKKRLLKK